MSNAENELLIFITRDNYSAAKDNNRTLPLANTQIIVPENAEITSPVLSVALIELTEDKAGAVAVALLSPIKLTNKETETGNPIVGIFLFPNPQSAMSFINDYADNWVGTHPEPINGTVEWKMILHDKTENIDPPSPEIAEMLAIIMEASFPIPYSFLDTTLKFLMDHNLEDELEQQLKQRDRMEQLLEAAWHDPSSDNQN